MKNIIIVGGGVAGLTALNRLVDFGIPTTLIEAGNYPSHKICGEFFSPECLPILDSWNFMPAEKIESISLITSHRRLSFPLSIPAGSQSRFEFDQRLVKRAEEKGAKILTNTKVKEIKKDVVILETGEALSYSQLMISSGRFFSASEPRYIGFKGHLQGVDVKNRLEMYLFPQGYAGLSSIGNGYSNFTCLLSMARYNRDNDLLSNIFAEAPQLKERLQNSRLTFDQWMTCQVPNFGIKKTPSWSNTYFIGDAAGTIPPASGLGLSIAITSGYMAAEYAFRNDCESFQKDWTHRYKRTFTYGQLLHKLFTSSPASEFALMLGKTFPRLAPTLFAKIRHH